MHDCGLSRQQHQRMRNPPSPNPGTSNLLPSREDWSGGASGAWQYGVPSKKAQRGKRPAHQREIATDLVFLSWHLSFSIHWYGHGEKKCK